VDLRGIRTPDFLSAIEAQGSSTVSTTYIWWYGVHNITTCGGISVQDVHIFHAVLLALHTVAHAMFLSMKQGKTTCIPVLEGEICFVVSVVLREVIPT